MYLNNFLWEDISKLSGLIDEIRGVSSGNRDVSESALIRRLNQPGCKPLEDIFLAWIGDSLAGYAEVHREVEISRAVVTGGVLQKFRLQGIGTALINQIQSHTENLKLRTLHVDVPEGDQSTYRLLTKLGFYHVRTHLHLQRMSTPLNNSNPLFPKNLEIRLIKDNEFYGLTRLQNEVFEGTWGFCPNSPDQIRYRILDLHKDPDPVMILLIENTMVGYCWSHTEGPGKPAQLGMLGVSIGYRGRGLGKLVTNAAIGHLLELKPSHINITVDDQNTPAVRLYTELGFKSNHNSHWLESPRT